MNSTLPFILLVTGLIASFLPNVNHIRRFAVVVGTSGILLFSLAGFTHHDGLRLILCLIAPGIVSFLLGSFLEKRGLYLAAALNLTIFICYGTAFDYLGFEFVISGKLALIPFLGGLIPLLGDLLGPLFRKAFNIDQQRAGTLLATAFGIMGLFFSIFQAQYFGPLLLGAGWLTTAVARERKSDAFPALGVLALGFLFLSVKLYGLSDTSFLRGNFVTGLAMGALAGMWVRQPFSGKWKWFGGTFLGLLAVMVPVLIGIANENFGAFPAFTGAGIGLALVQLASHSNRGEMPLLLIVLGILPLVTWIFPAPKITTGGSSVAVNQVVKPEPLAGSSINLNSQFEGVWKSVADHSKVNFRLGPEGGITDGAFKKFAVEMAFDENGAPEKMTVNLDASSLTTFNPMRDESVLGEEYINAGKFGTMTYESRSFKREGDSFFVDGSFTMLGKASPVNLEIKFIGNGMDAGKQYLQFIGRGKVDRTRHGMPSDAKIGNLVDVYFEIRLQK